MISNYVIVIQIYLLYLFIIHELLINVYLNCYVIEQTTLFYHCTQLFLVSLYLDT